MKNLFFSVLTLLIFSFTNAQSTRPLDKGTEPEWNKLVDTKIEVSFDFSQSRMHGKTWITLKPVVSKTDSLRLDAKGMFIHEISMVKKGKKIPLKYNYSDSMNLRIKLDQTYKKDDAYTVFIDYTSRPNDLKVKGSEAITDAKGLYFINPLGLDSTKPTQIWTQGETEATSVWVPTIDRPNQKTMQQISMTVPSKFTTLSNGLLISSKKNENGSRTDVWKMEHPHAPYLFFMGVGDYSIIKDRYKGKEVSYYVEPAFKDVARKIFGATPEMMQFFAEKLGVDYVWSKYAQITGQDYVSGAMENTTATLHSSMAQQNARELVDENKWEDVISHELFHHWFGDLVTAENWGNLTVNESFADYSEYLWREYKYGRDYADDLAFQAQQSYLNTPGASAKKLVRYDYKDKEDMFDVVSYQKGGRILHMLRNYVGDDIFFKSLNHYLNQNKFGTGTAKVLQQSFEANCKKDIAWFFDQWYYGSGHPSLEILYTYDEEKKEVKFTINQLQKKKVFKFPLSIEFYTDKNSRKQFDVMVENQSESFTFSSDKKPVYYSVDPDRIILSTRKETKAPEHYLFQIQNASSYFERRQAIEYAKKTKDKPLANQILKTALNDAYPKLKILALNYLDSTSDTDIWLKVEQMAENETNRLVKAEAINLLAHQRNPKYKNLFLKNLNDSSYSVAGAALGGLYWVSPEEAESFALKQLTEEIKGALFNNVIHILSATNNEKVGDIIITRFAAMPLSDNKISMIQPLAQYLSNTINTKQFIKGIDEIVNLVDKIPSQYRQQVEFYIYNIIFTNILSKKEVEVKEKSDNESALKDQIDYLQKIKNK